MNSIDILGVPEVQETLEAFVAMLGDVCHIFFPRRIVVPGLFVSQSCLWSEFRRRFNKAGVMRGTRVPDLVADQRSATLEPEGAAQTLFVEAIDGLL